MDRLAPKRAPEALVDAWSWAQPIRMTGWVERNQFNPLLAAGLVLVGGFVIFNIIGAIVVGVGMVGDIMEGGELSMTPEALLTNHGGLLLGGNTLGQWLGFTLVACLMARWSTPDWKEFLRIRRPDGVGFLLAGVGWAVFYPLVLWLGEMNTKLPLPESLREFDAAQADMVEMLLMGTDLPTWFLFIAVAITPAICEELIFRGYLQRQVERSLGMMWSIVLVGVVFGLYHLQLTKALPLAALGVYLGFVVWATGSVWTGTLVHLLNNGLAVLGVAYVRSQPEMDVEALEGMGLPWYLAAASAVATAAVVYFMLQRRRALVGETEDAQPVHVPDPPSLSASPSYV
ncbi:hypothetical protein BSZ36_10020 [Rubricoccus marinus]|uniref:CAAX prenyl protease 2/Lysostaphin resistance protein A-like domain-containing protein n=2 Tax=Rubricoccus marinus TaxID=716817 RepID=A0A259TZT1_9BACT|nr:hypothetical protein BSZ36_10020 [Rubricoccus marinus]